MVIWIDPLDGSQSFMEGHLNHVTCMIGLAINKRPRAGIIHKPFYDQNLMMERTYFGTPECGVFVKDRFTTKLKRHEHITPVPPFYSEQNMKGKDYKLWVVGSMNMSHKH